MSRKKETAPKRALLPADKIMEQIGPRVTSMDAEGMPWDMAQWVENVAMKNSRYLYYDEPLQAVRGEDGIKRNATIVYCTHCGAMSAVSTEKGSGTLHRKAGKCPACGTKATYLYRGKARWTRDETPIQLVQRIEGGVVVRQFRYCRDYGERSDGGYRRPWECFTEQYRILISYSGQRYVYEWKYLNDHSGKWDERWVRRKKNPEGLANWYGAVYTRNLHSVLRGTPWRYSGLYEAARIPQQRTEELARFEFGFSPYVLLRAEDYLCQYLRYPCMEFLSKLGFNRLLYFGMMPIVDMSSMGYYYVSNTDRVAEVNPSGKSLREVLPVTDKRDVKMLAEMDARALDLRLCAYLRKECGQTVLKREYIEVLHKALNRRYTEKNMKNVLQYTTLHKACRYLKEQMARRKPGERDNVMGDWLDYLGEVRMLGWNMADQFVLFPRNLAERHEETAMLVREKEHAVEYAACKRACEAYATQYSYSYKGICTVAPRGAQDIVTEGTLMHNCVASYIGRVPKEETAILFVRKESEPEKPFYTMEVRDGKVIQCRAIRNGPMTPEVKAFVAAFEKNVLRKEKAENAVQIRCAV